MQEMLFDLMKDTRNEVKDLNKAVHDHILLTEKRINDMEKKIVEAKQPATFLTILGNVIVKLGAAAGLFAAVKTFMVK